MHNFCNVNNEKMQKQIKKYFIILTASLAIPCFAWGATGDTLFQCDFEGDTGTYTTPKTMWTNYCGAANDFSGNNTASIITSGGQDGGQALRFSLPAAVTDGGGYEPYKTNALTTNSATVVYWERYNVDASVNGNWNCKGVRVLSNGSDYIGGTVTRWGGNRQMIGHLVGIPEGSGTMTTTSAISWVAGYPNYDSTTYSGYCTDLQSLGIVNGNTNSQPLTCHLGRYAAFNGSATNWETTWHKVRLYVKQPTTINASDGVIMYWIDDVLLATISGVNGGNSIPSGVQIGQVSFNPQNGFFGNPDPNSPAFYHEYDDIVVYEGYVPPEGPDNVSPASPSGLSVS